MPKVSVNIITHNRKDLLVRAVASVQRQTYEDKEVIIFVNNSTDGTNEKLASLGLNPEVFRIIQSKESLSITEARRRVMEMSLGEYVAVLDDDDVWLDKEKLEKQINFLDNNRKVSVLGSWAELVDEHGDKKGILSPPVRDLEIKRTILNRCPFVHSSVVFRKKNAMEVGGYLLKDGLAEDYDLWLRIGIHSELANISEELVLYQTHSNSISRINKFLGTYNGFKLVISNRKNYPGFYKYIFIWMLRIIKSAIWLKFR